MTTSSSQPRASVSVSPLGEETRQTPALPGPCLPRHPVRHPETDTPPTTTEDPMTTTPETPRGPVEAGVSSRGPDGGRNPLETVRLSSQCTAHSKRTGERCKRQVRGGGVCVMHGGGAPQVAAAREARVAQIRARAYGVTEDRTPAEALLASSSSLDATLQRLESLAAQDGGADPVLLREIRSAASESARVAKLVQDAGLDERRVRLAEREQADVVAVIGLALGAFGVDASTADVRRVVAAAVERVRSGVTGPLPAVVPALPSGAPKNELEED